MRLYNKLDDGVDRATHGLAMKQRLSFPARNVPKMLCTVGLLAVFASNFARAQIIPSSTVIDWTTAGIPGGIPTNRSTIFVNVLTTTNVTYRCFTNGTDCSKALAAAMTACPSNQVVYMPPGTYMLTNVVGCQNSYYTLRGAGKNTVLACNFPASMYAVIMGNPDYVIPTNLVFNVSSGYTKGSTNLYLGSFSNVTAGTILTLDQLNDASAGITSTGSLYTTCAYCDRGKDGTRNLFQLIKVTAVNSNQISFTPPLHWTYSASLQPQASIVNGVVHQVGLENFTMTDPSSNVMYYVFLQGGDQCWMSNLETVASVNVQLFWYKCFQSEMTHCYMHQAPNYTTDAGYGMEARCCTGLLVDNNIFRWLEAELVFDCGDSGCVVAYNYFTKTCTSASDPGFSQQAIDMNHGAYPKMNLVEGNVANSFREDLVLGSGGYTTAYRNWLTGTDLDSTYNRKVVDLDSYCWHNNVVGNVLGSTLTNGITTWTYSDGGTNNFNNNLNVIYRLGYPFPGNNDYECCFPTNYDPQVAATLFRHANYDYATSSIIWSNGYSHILSNSLYLTSKPSWWGDRLAWPPFDPNNPSVASVTNIPAGYRYTYGVDPTGNPGTFSFFHLE
jgi:hypothetical protein